MEQIKVNLPEQLKGLEDLFISPNSEGGFFAIRLNPRYSILFSQNELNGFTLQSFMKKLLKEMENAFLRERLAGQEEMKRQIRELLGVSNDDD